jgi:hypothetical protein
MSVTVRVVVEDVESKLETYSKIELERSTSPSSGFAEITEITLVAGTYYYSYEDPNGSSSNYYRYRFSNAADTEKSTYSNAFRAEDLTRTAIRQAVIKNHRTGRVMLTSAAGDSTSVITADPTFKFSGFEANRSKNSIIYLVSGPAAGEWRRVASTDPPNGDFTVDPAFSVAPGSGSQFELHWLTDPETYHEAINRAVKRYWFHERVPITPVENQTEYSLANVPWLVNGGIQITGLWFKQDPTGNLPANPWTGGGGRWWNWRNDFGLVTLEIQPAPSTSYELYLEAWRQLEPLYTDAAVLPSFIDLEFIAALTYDEILSILLEPGEHGLAIDRGAIEFARLNLQPTLANLRRRNSPRVRYALPVFDTPNRVPRVFKGRG